MIGVVVSEDNLEAAREFFELFKTPWERAVPGRNYRVILATIDPVDGCNARVIIMYGSGKCGVDHKEGLKGKRLSGPVDIEWGRWTFPVYAGVRVFETEHEEGTLKLTGRPIDHRSHTRDCLVWRIGYDLFEEVRYLLTEGQPSRQALIPTLELHIELLRHILIESGNSFLEIPPRPHGFNFVCCLTHDVDFFGIRRHRFDRTLAGFLYRSSVGSLIDLFCGHRTLSEVAKNWLAFCSLPFVFGRLLPDFWRPFEDYAKVEDRQRSTFFLVPFRGKPGVSPDGKLNIRRATPYGISDVREEVQAATRSGSELGVHGIDAWHDADAGHEEMKQLASITGQTATGIRMHWLYFGRDSPRQLEKAGFSYDSTCGYNETVGYRAGTPQAFRPLGCSTLLELPMSIMDSALFSSGRMGLSPVEALRLSGKIVGNATRFGGTLVINWHERSLAPERLLGRSYQELVKLVSNGDRVWFARAGEAVEWFRWRRSIRFREAHACDGTRIQVSAPGSRSPGVEIRIHRPKPGGGEIRSFDGTAPVEFQV